MVKLRRLHVALYQKLPARILLCFAVKLTFGLSFEPRILLPLPRSASSSLASAAFDKVEKLIPEENPNLDPQRKSLSGVLYSHVLEGLNQLYPPEALDERNAASRTDGYWPFIQQGQDPPKQFTYGEFDFVFLAELLDKAHGYYKKEPNNTNSSSSKEEEANDMAWNDKVFCDIGSGTGRLVFGAAALHPGWKLCRGIEILKTISDVAKTKVEVCRESVDAANSVQQQKNATVQEEEEEWVENDFGLLVRPETRNEGDDKGSRVDHNATGMNEPIRYSIPFGNNANQRLPMAPVEFVCGSFDDPYNYFGDVDCVFCFSSCMSTSILGSLSQSIGRQCRPGTIVITTDFHLLLEGTIPPYPDDETLPHGEYQLELLEQTDGYCWLTGGHSTAFIHRVRKSLWNGSGPRVKPELPASEKAFRAIKAMEETRDEAAVRFLNGVRNDMSFAGFPERWLPDPNNYQSRNIEGGDVTR